MDDNSRENNQQPAGAEKPEPLGEEKLDIKHVLTSVLAAAIGVQNRKNQQRDFNNRSSIYIYVSAGVVFTALFVVAVYAVVKLVLRSAGA